MNPKRFLPMIIVVGVLGTCSVGISAMSQANPEGGMILKEEMLALEQVFETIIDAVIFDNMELIKPQIPPFHEARKRVEEAISAGQKIQLPKNKNRFKEFVKLDDKFHKDLGTLEEAAEKGQKGVVKDLTHKLFDACVACHERFRK